MSSGAPAGDPETRHDEAGNGSPLRHLFKEYSPQSAIFSLVMDALVECESAVDMQRILSLLARIHEIPALRVRIFLISRPELPVELGSKDLHENDHRDLFLGTFQRPAIEHDIRLYFQDQSLSI